MAKYSFKSIYKYLSPLFKHTVDIYRMAEVTDSDFLTYEERILLYSDVECYATQEVRAPYLAVNNDDALRISGYYVLHVKYDVDIRTGDYVVVRLPSNRNVELLHGYLGRVRIGTATRRALINLEDTKSQSSGLDVVGDPVDVDSDEPYVDGLG